ncbi:serine protease inhibitor dipetalogastin-like [Frankliniella occidentalis]|uniref:Serine protease inhibitor dipetalogastin-like n=1 Tax=Frankliniella occidentalis TaxID=133901 RepID=A0A6J1SVH5_FRAOC|nr:serine protease inhibitor dipetalogastin-like [Frankliniella occidentalis]XP_052125266.1 serine protease inhibitor dipetalogastin-like [Frankliniella occidentalis]
MLPAMLLLLAPLALACPCPPATAASEVCGSDLATYPSQCHLDCAAEPGLSLQHPGPCSPQDPAQQRRRLLASEELRQWDECNKGRDCPAATCSECGPDDRDCAVMCRLNCECGCGGYPPGGMDYRLWEACNEGRGCLGRAATCTVKCVGEEDEKECRDPCERDWRRCDCGCTQLAGNRTKVRREVKAVGKSTKENNQES